MDNDSGRALRRGLSFPFFLSLLAFGAVLADRYFSEPGFLVSSAYREQLLFAVGTVVTALLLWLWVLAAARRGSERFEGPIQTVRGSNGALQPLFATVFLVVAANLAYSHSMPKWLNFLVADDVETRNFIIASAPTPPRRGCSFAKASNAEFGEVELCLPGELDADPGATIAVTGARSYFGLQPGRYAFAEDGLIEPQLTVEPASTSPLAMDTLRDLIEEQPGAGTPIEAGKTQKNR